MSKKQRDGGKHDFREPQKLNNDIFKTPKPYEDGDIVEANDPTETAAQKRIKAFNRRLKKSAAQLQERAKNSAMDTVADAAYDAGFEDNQQGRAYAPPTGAMAVLRAGWYMAAFMTVMGVGYTVFSDASNDDPDHDRAETTTPTYYDERPVDAAPLTMDTRYAHDFPNGYVNIQPIQKIHGLSIIDGVTITTKFNNLAGNDNGSFVVTAHVDGHYSAASASVPSIAYDKFTTFGDYNIQTSGKRGLRQEFVRFSLPDINGVFTLTADSDGAGGLSAHLDFKPYDR